MYKIKNLPMCDEDGKLSFRLLLLIGLFYGSLLATNTITSKIMQWWVFVLSIGSVTYCATFLITDVINEVWGKRICFKLVLIGIPAQACMMIIYYIGIYAPGASFFPEVSQKAFEIVFGAVPRILIASWIAYMMSQTFDVWFFSKIKEWTQGRFMWFRNNLSTPTSQLLDCLVFVTLAFAFTMPAKALVSMIFTTWIVKTLVAFGDTPFFYVLVKWARGWTKQYQN